MFDLRERIQKLQTCLRKFDEVQAIRREGSRHHLGEVVCAIELVSPGNKGGRIAIREFVEKGGSAWFFHNANYISGGNADFRHVEGALFTGHTDFRPYKMKIVNADHPITRGVKDFVVTEEQHYLLYDKDPKTVLVRSVNEEGRKYSTPAHGDQGATCEACWAYDYGKGRVCYMAPGHTIPSLWNPEYVKLQRNALRWLLRQA